MFETDRGLDEWLQHITGDDLAAAQRAVGDYAERCSAARAKMFAGSDPDADLTSQWLSLMSLGARVVGDLVKRSVETEDPARRESINSIGRAIQAASAQLSHRSTSNRGSQT